MLCFSRRPWLFASFAIVFAAGCGGSGGGGGGQTPAAVSPVVTLRWSDRARVVIGPASALSVDIVFHRDGATDYTLPVNRRTAAAGYTETLTVPQTFTPGRLDVTYRFHSQANGAGDVVAVAYASATMTANGEGLDVVTTEGNVSAVTVPAGQTVTIGQTKDLTVETRDAHGAIVAVTPGSIFWTSDAPTTLSIGATGAQGVKRGPATVRATVDGKASGPATVRVVNVAALTQLGTSTFDCLLSADGQTVFGRRDTGSGEATFTWREGGALNAVPSAGGFGDFVPRAMSADGRIAVGSALNGDGVRRATVWTSGTAGSGAGAFSTLGTLTGDTAEQSEATGVSADGMTVVGASDSPIGPQAFRWRTGLGMLGLGDFSTADDDMSFSRATGVSADGSVIIGQARLGDAQRRGFVWMVGAGLREIGAVVSPDSPSVEVTPTVVDATGSEVFGYADETAWRWQSGGGSTDLGAGRFMPIAAGGGALFGTSNEAAAAMWTPSEGLRDLGQIVSELGLSGSLAGFQVAGVSGASADGGRVLLLGSKPDGSRGTFLLTLP